LTKSIHISLPENQVWPPALRDRINLCFSNWSSKVWDVRVVPGTSETVLMQSFYEGDQPVLTIAAIRLLVLVRVQGGLALGIDRPSSVTYAIALAHEVVHLERSPEEWKRQRTPQDLFEEEVRTWEIVSREIVRPLIALGEPVEPEMAEIDSILLNRCGDSGRNCPAFRGWLQGGHRKHN
jgi:hypothetical protein